MKAPDEKPDVVKDFEETLVSRSWYCDERNDESDQFEFKTFT